MKSLFSHETEGKKVNRKFIVIVFALLIALTVAACAGNEEQNSIGTQVNEHNSTKDMKEMEKTAIDQNEPPVPVTIQVGVKKSGYLTDEEFQSFFVDPVKKNYPWITVERVIHDDNLLPEQVAAKAVPDLIITNNVNGIPAIANLDLLVSLDDHLKQYDIDLSRFLPEAIEAVKAAAIRDDIIALPYTRNFNALYYNKDLFDEFAVEYPKDGMTWEEAADLGVRLTREVNGVQYRGLEPNVPERMASQLSLGFVDPKTNKAVVNTDLWKTVMQTAAKIYSIPGNDKHGWKTSGQNQFMKDQILAMLAEVNILVNLSKVQDLNWDLASYPVFAEASGKAAGPDLHIMVPASTSEHLDEVFLVMKTVLSDEVQAEMSRLGKLSIMNDKKYEDVFGEKLDFLKDKNTQAIFKTIPASPYQPSLYDTEAMKIIQAELRAMWREGKDVNSALRDAEQLINQHVEAASK